MAGCCSKKLSTKSYELFHLVTKSVINLCFGSLSRSFFMFKLVASYGAASEKCGDASEPAE